MCKNKDLSQLQRKVYQTQVKNIIFKSNLDSYFTRIILLKNYLNFNLLHEMSNQSNFNDREIIFLHM